MKLSPEAISLSEIEVESLDVPGVINTDENDTIIGVCECGDRLQDLVFDTTGSIDLVGDAPFELDFWPLAITETEG